MALGQVDRPIKAISVVELSLPHFFNRIIKLFIVCLFVYDLIFKGSLTHSLHSTLEVRIPSHGIRQHGG